MEDVQSDQKKMQNINLNASKISKKFHSYPLQLEVFLIKSSHQNFIFPSRHLATKGFNNVTIDRELEQSSESRCH